MSDDIKGLRDDIAFMRALAEEGRAPPLLGGVVLVSAGLIYSVATLFCWAMTTKLITAPFVWYTGVWVIAMIIHGGVIGVLVSSSRQARPHGAAATNNQAFQWAWMGCGYAIVAIFAGSLLSEWQLHSWLVFATFPTIIFSIYGAAWTVSAALSGQAWLRWVAGGCFVAAVGLAAAPTVADAYLAFAAALLLLMTAPGIALMRRERPAPV